MKQKWYECMNRSLSPATQHAAKAISGGHVVAFRKFSIITEFASVINTKPIRILIVPDWASAIYVSLSQEDGDDMAPKRARKEANSRNITCQITHTSVVYQSHNKGKVSPFAPPPIIVRPNRASIRC